MNWMTERKAGRGALCWVLLSAAVILAIPVPVAAQSGPDSETDDTARPWSAGVSSSDRVIAGELHKQGNDLLKQQLFADALVKYRAALEHWDHPRIHYHITLALIQLGGDPLAAYHSVSRALRHDGAALKPDQLERARDYRLLLRGQLVEIRVRCDQPGVEVTIDGETALVGPGSASRLRRPGQYQVAATRAGHLAVTRSVLLLPGEDRVITFHLFTFEQLTGTRRLWQPWKPWATAGAGAAVVALGSVLHWRARSDIRRFDRELQTRPECAVVGCNDDDPGSPAALLTRGELQQDIAITGYVVGGAMVASGLVMAYLNRPRSYRIDRSDESFRVTVIPRATPESIGVVAAGSF